MKRIFIVMVAIIFATTFNISAEQQTAPVTTTFTANITCQNCVNRITKALSQERGVRDLRINLATRTVAVTYRPDRITKGQVSKKISDLGFNVEEKTVDENKAR